MENSDDLIDDECDDERYLREIIEEGTMEVGEGFRSEPTERMPSSSRTKCIFDTLQTREDMVKYLESIHGKASLDPILSHLRVSDKTPVVVTAEIQSKFAVRPIDMEEETGSPILESAKDPTNAVEAFGSSKISKCFSTLDRFNCEGEMQFNRNDVIVTVNNIKNKFYVYFRLQAKFFVSYYCRPEPVVFKANMTGLANIFNKTKTDNMLLIIKESEIGTKIRVAHGDSNSSSDLHECGASALGRPSLEHNPRGHFQRFAEVEDLTKYETVVEFSPEVFASTFQVKRSSDRFVANVIIDSQKIEIHVDQHCGIKSTKQITRADEAKEGLPLTTRIIKFSSFGYNNISFPLDDIHHLHKLNSSAQSVTMYLSRSRPVVIEYLINNIGTLRLFVLTLDGIKEASTATSSPGVEPKSKLPTEDFEGEDDEVCDDEETADD
jgi:hypothetical protein